MTHTVRVARNAVALSFALNGFCFASWISRIPEARDLLELTNSQLGLLLLALSAGSVLALPSAGALIERLGAATVVRCAATLDALGLVVAGIGAAVTGEVGMAAAGLFVYGLGVGVWDVAMNVEGAGVERELRRTVMPRFHAAFSLGTVLGAGLGALTVWREVPMEIHLGAVAVGALALAWWSAGRFWPVSPEKDSADSPRRSSLAAWTEPRTLLIGLMVLALALTEGTANDWLAVALVDGYAVEHWVAVVGYAVFVASMTVGRLLGPVLLDRRGRVGVLWATMVAAGIGVVLIVWGGHPALVVLGIVLWGLGASLGFPVGMSAAADESAYAAARVGVVSTIGYTAFLAGPPLLGFVADRVGTLHALLVVSLVLIPSAMVVPSARERATPA